MNMLFKFILPLVIWAMVCLLFRSKLSMPVFCCLHFIPSLSYSMLFMSTSERWWNIALCVAFLVVLYPLVLFIASKIQNDFKGHVISLSLIPNLIMSANGKNRGEKGNRLIGRVMPYNRYQLRWNGKMIEFGNIPAAGGLLIQGGTGSGKTYGILSMIRQNVVDGNSVIFAEFKGDPEVIEKLKNFVEPYGYDVYEVSSGHGDFNYDPLLRLNISGRVEAIMNMRKWSLDGADAHYRTGVQLLLQKTLGYFSSEWNSTHPDAMSQNGESFTVSYMLWLKKYSSSREEWDAYNTVLKLLELLITGSLQDVFCFKNGKTLRFDQIKNKKFLLVVSFPSSNKEQATSFSSLIFRDLLDELTVEAPQKTLFVYVDEFGTLDNPFIVKDMIEKGRSAKIALALSLQDVNQVVIQTNEAYLNSMLGTINTFIVYSGSTKVTAEKLAGVQIAEIEPVLMNLRKPLNGKKPTAIYISKYPSVNKMTNSEVFRFEPYIYWGEGKRKTLEAHAVRHRDDESQKLLDEQRESEWKKMMDGQLTEDELEAQKREKRFEHPLESVQGELPLSQPTNEDDDLQDAMDIDSSLSDLIFGPGMDKK